MPKDLKRKELYNLVWEKPIMELAKEYGLSDRGLGRLCERHNIPKPPRGYWRKIQTGQKIKKEKLTKAKNPIDDEKIILTKQIKRKPENNLSEDVEILIDRESHPKNKITVPSKLSKHHPIVDKMNKKHKPVSQIERRERRILSTLLFALEQRGFTVEPYEKHGGKVTIELEEEKLCIAVREKLKMYKKEITEEDRAKNFYYTDDKYATVYEGTGNLVLAVSAHGYGILYREFIESKDKPLEGMLNKITAYLIKKCYLERAETLERREQWRKDEEEQLIRERQQKLLELEHSKRSELVKQSSAWIKATNIRNYVAAANENKCQNKDIEYWTKWALNYADKIDPLTKITEEIFHEETHENAINNDIECISSASSQ